MYGISWNSETIRAYRVSGYWWLLLTLQPYINATLSMYNSLVADKNSKNEWTRKYNATLTLRKKFLNAFSCIPSTYSYGFKAFRVQILSHVMNWWLKPKVTLTQVKEKYGSLRVSFYSTSDEISSHIEKLVRETEMKLAIKGAYYPIHEEKPDGDKEPDKSV